MRAFLPDDRAILYTALQKSLAKAPPLDGYRTLFGFDGYIDVLYSVVRNRTGAEGFSIFKTLSQFASHIKENAQVSADHEVILKEKRAGGNGPPTAHSLASLGCTARCIGLFGEDEPDSVFASIYKNCELYTVGEPAKSISLEFLDGKLMLGELDNLHALDWEMLVKAIGFEALVSYVADSNLVGILNWAATLHMEDILLQLQNTLFPLLSPEALKKKVFFFDFSDLHSRNEEDFLHLADMLGTWSEKMRVVVSLNENEAAAAAKMMHLTPRNASEMCSALLKALRIEQVVMHTKEGAFACNEQSACSVPGFFVQDAKLTTGGGDNFNAGLCVGLLMGLPLEEQLLLAGGTASYYTFMGKSGTLEQVANYLQKRIFS